MIADNFRVVLTKNFRIVADVFIKRVFKGNTVTDHDSASCRTSMSTQIVEDRLAKPVSVVSSGLSTTCY